MNKKFVIAVFMAALIFSTMEVALKVAGSDFDTLQLTFLRFIIAGISLLPLAVKQMKEKGVSITRNDYIYLWFIGTLLICISMTCFQEATRHANANLVAIMISSNPVFAMIFAHFFAGERFTKRKALVLVISVVGLIVYANPFNLAEGNTMLGFVLGIIVSVSFGLYAALSKKAIRKLGGIPQLSVSFILGSLSLLIVLLVTKRPIFAGITLQTLPLLAYLGFIVTAAGYYFYFKGIDLGGAGNGSIAFFMKPMLAPIVAYIVLREAVTLNMVVGILLLLTGSIINLLGAPANAKR